MGKYTDVIRQDSYFGSRLVLVRLLLFHLLLFSVAVADETASAGVLSGTWGGRGASLNAGETGVEIEFDCAWGRIEGSIVIQPAGGFNVDGVYLPEPGGPGRAGDAEPPGIAAVYSGVREGSEILLTVELPQLNRVVGSFALKKAQQAELEKCL